MLKVATYTASASRWNKLYKEAQQGSKDAIEELYLLAAPKIKSMANTLGRTQSAKEDLFAIGDEIFVELVNQKKSVKKAENYLTKSIHRTMVNARQQHAIHSRRLTCVGDLRGYIEAHACPTSTRKANQNSRTFLHEIYQQLQLLDKKAREIFIAKTIYGEKGPDIAKKFKITEAAVHQIVCRTKKELKSWASK